MTNQARIVANMQANIQKVKNNLSGYLEKVLKGEEVVVSRYNVPIARIIPIAPARKKNKTILGRSRNLGRITGKVTGPFFRESDWQMLRQRRS